MSLCEINQPAPDLTLEGVSGNPVSLSQFKGKKTSSLFKTEALSDNSTKSTWRSCA